MKILQLRHVLQIFLLGGIACWLLNCHPPTPISDLGGSEVVGVVTTADQKPVSGAELRVLILTPRISDPGVSDTSVMGIAFSDTKGKFRFDSLRTASYTLVATYNNDSLLLKPLQLTLDKDSLVDLGTLIMKAPGAIKGVVVLAANGPDADINCSIAGTSFGAHTTRSHPDFTISGIFPVDTSYELTCWAPGYKRVTLDSILVRAGMATVLADTIRLELGTEDIPSIAPENLSVIYDTVSGIAKITWQSVSIVDVHRYIIYSSFNDENREDTVSDTTGAVTVFESGKETDKRTVLIQVAALDDDYLVGPRGKADTLIAIPPSWLRVQLQLEKVDENSTVDTACVVVTYSSNIRHVDSIVWRCDSTPVSAKKLTTEKTAGTDTVRLPTFASGKRLYVKLVDNSGKSWTDSLDATTLLPIDAWATVDSMKYARRYANACAVQEKIFVFGGGVEKTTATGTSLKPVTYVEVYDTHLRTWKVLAGKMVTARFKAAAAVVDGKIYVFGGLTGQAAVKTIEQYSPETDSWIIIDSMPQPMFGASACVAGGVVYIIGGKSGTDENPVMLKTIATYQPQTRKWGTAGDLTTPRVLHQAGIANDKIVIYGGLDSAGEEPLSDIEAVSLQGTNTLLPSMSLPPRFNFGAVVIGERLMIIGGLAGTLAADKPVGSVSVCLLSSGENSDGAEMPSAREGIATAVLGGKVFVLGGGDSAHNSTRSVYVYYP